MAGVMENIGSFVANPFGLGDLGAGALDYLADSLGLSNKKQVAEGQAAIDNIMAEATRVGDANRSLFGNYMGQMQGIYGQGASQYNDAVKRLSDAIGGAPEQFQYGGNVEDFYDKFANQRQQAAMNAMGQQAAAGGNRWSSDFMNNMAAKQQALSTEAWENAYNKMMQDRQQQLSEWQAGQASKQNYVGNLGTMAGLYGNDRNAIANAMGDYISNVANQNNADLQTRADLTMGKANLGMQKSSGAGGLLSGIGSIIGSIFS